MSTWLTYQCGSDQGWADENGVPYTSNGLGCGWRANCAVGYHEIDFILDESTLDPNAAPVCDDFEVLAKTTDPPLKPGVTTTEATTTTTTRTTLSTTTTTTPSEGIRIKMFVFAENVKLTLRLRLRPPPLDVRIRRRRYRLERIVEFDDGR